MKINLKNDSKITREITRETARETAREIARAGQFVGSFFRIIMGFKNTAGDKEWNRYRIRCIDHT